jgi:aspartyl-tRNA(Asn)/glutamyl-tRNA(Gln) amidotransferase subunit C
MPIDKEEVRRIARLARLEHAKTEADQLLDDATLELLAAEISGILDHVKELSAVDTRNVPPTSHGVPLPPLFREDIPAEASDPDRLLASTPQRSGDAVRVPKIVE